MIERVRRARPRGLLLGGLLLGGLALSLLAGCGSLAENVRVPGPDEYRTGSNRDGVRGRLGGTDGIV
ncbi:MAG: hypothetical protein O9325_15300, partial [Roseomonas sp.]|nr:hypothetical protein [Roseomonas sp.]